MKKSSDSNKDITTSPEYKKFKKLCSTRGGYLWQAFKYARQFKGALNSRNLFARQFLTSIALKTPASIPISDCHKFVTGKFLDDIDISDIIYIIEASDDFDLYPLRLDLLMAMHRNGDKWDDYKDCFEYVYNADIANNTSLLIRKASACCCHAIPGGLQSAINEFTSLYSRNPSLAINIMELIIRYNASDCIASIMDACDDPYDFNVNNIDNIAYNVRMSQDWMHEISSGLISKFMLNDDYAHQVLGRFISYDEDDYWSNPVIDIDNNVYASVDYTDYMVPSIRAQMLAWELITYYEHNHDYMTQPSLNSLIGWHDDRLISALKAVYNVRMMPMEYKHECFMIALNDNAVN